MAIHTPNITLVDLGTNDGPAAFGGQQRHGLQLVRRFAMIELKDHGIGLTAADARMLQ